jgi:phage terminase large subunit
VNNSSPLEDFRGTKQNYRNLKSQCYFLLASKINLRQIAVKSMGAQQQELLTEELEQVRQKDMDKDGKLAMEPKEEMKERLGRSPDYADALMMRMWFDLNHSTSGMKPKQYRPSNLVRNLHAFNQN